MWNPPYQKKCFYKIVYHLTISLDLETFCELEEISKSGDGKRKKVDVLVLFSVSGEYHQIKGNSPHRRFDPCWKQLSYISWSLDSLLCLYLIQSTTLNVPYPPICMATTMRLIWQSKCQSKRWDKRNNEFLRYKASNNCEN